MPGFVLAPAAVDDLSEIWLHIAAESAATADRIENQMFEAFERLAQHPGLGHRREDLTDRDVRFWPVESFVIVYLETADEVQIVAVVRGTRDIPTILRFR
jgi:plasmid stabilization system protein ParE